jgi:uncharacterized protein
MNLIRLITFAVLFWLLYRLILALLNKASRPTPRATQTREGTMVRCEQCGLHIPQEQALTKGDKYYCCEEHRDGVDNWKRDE